MCAGWCAELSILRNPAIDLVLHNRVLWFRFFWGQFQSIFPSFYQYQKPHDDFIRENLTALFVVLPVGKRIGYKLVTNRL